MTFTTDMSVLTITLAVMVFFFLSGKISIDLVAMSGLIFLTLSGFIPTDLAFSGFASTAIITMIATFIISAALTKTGVAEALGKGIYRFAGSREVSNIIAVMLVSALLSAFMNNVAAVAVLLPVVVSLAYETDIPPSRLLIPLCYGVILGGTTTLIGTAPNIIITDIMYKSDVVPFGFSDFTPFGVGILIVGIIAIVLVGRHLLPSYDVSKGGRKHKRQLVQLYNLYERVFSLRIPRGSTLHGKSLSAAAFGGTLGVQVLGVVRNGKKWLAPKASHILQERDLLIVGGRLEDLELLLRFQGLEVDAVHQEELRVGAESVEGIHVEIKEDYIGETLRDLNFRGKYGVVVAGIEREEEIVAQHLPTEVLQKNDVLHVLGSSENIGNFIEQTGLSIIKEKQSLEGVLHQELFILRVPKESCLSGLTILESRLGELVGTTVIGVLRDRSLSLALSSDFQIAGGDGLIVAGDQRQIQRLKELGELVIESSEVESGLESRDIGILEAVLAPRSRFIDKTLRELNFRERFGFQVLALWRDGRPFRSRVADIKLKFGDALLLQGPRKRMPILSEDPGMVLVSAGVQPARRVKKAKYAVLALLVMIVLSVLKIQPVHVAAFCGAIIVALTGAIRMQEAYREVEWRIVFLVACLIPIGIAIEASGLAEYAAHSIVEAVGHLGTPAILIGLGILASFLSQILDASVTVVLLAPITIKIAQELGIEVRPCLMVVAISASLAFLTPFSHKVNLLVMGPGGYRTIDYFKIGLLLTVLTFATLIGLVLLAS